MDIQTLIKHFLGQLQPELQKRYWDWVRDDGGADLSYFFSDDELDGFEETIKFLEYLTDLERELNELTVKAHKYHAIKTALLS